MTSESQAAVTPAAFETSEKPDADIDLAVSSLLIHVRNSVQTEISPTPNQVSQSSDSPNADLHLSTEASLYQTQASSLQLYDQNYSNSENDTFHSVVEESSPRNQQLVPPIAQETTEIETPRIQGSSTSES